MVIFVLIFAFLQAMTDLYLPNIMSNIINNGIQRNGIINSVPDAIRKTEYEKLSLFLTDDEERVVEDNYILIDKNSSSQEDYDKYIAIYPVLNNESIYILNTTDEDRIAELDLIFGKAIMSVSSINKLVEENGAQGAFEIIAEQSGGSGQNLQIPSIGANADVFVILKQVMSGMTSEQIQQIRDTVDEQMKDVSEALLSQATTPYITEEYKAMGVDMIKYQRNYIIKMGGIMLLIAIGGMICTLVVSYLSSKTSMGFGRDIGRDLFSHVSTFSLEEFDEIGTASLITRNTNDVTQVQGVIMLIFRMMITAPMMCIGGIIMAISKARSMSWMIIVVIAALFIVIFVFGLLAIPFFQKMQGFIDKINLVLREKLMGIRVIRAFNREDYESKRFEKANTDFLNNALKVYKIMAIITPIMMIIMNCTSLAVLWFGAHNVDTGSMQVGDMLAFSQYMMQIMMAFMMLTMMFVMIPRAEVSAVRINKVFAIKPKIKDADKASDLSNFKSEDITLEFKDVTFSYEGAEQPALRNISFKSKSGETTAIIGSTGSGKTSLVNLIPRFYEVESGSIELNGINIKDISQESLRNKIGFIPQKAILFSGSIDENMKYGKQDATDEEIKKAAEIAQAMDFINDKEEGFDTYISQGGTNVSGGQKQRLSIARALVRKPDIYVFDDSFSALDFKTDARLRAALKEEVKDAMLIIVAQRVSTVMDADRIIVLDGGEMVGIGTHKELLKDCPTYKEIVLSQLSEEEIA